MPRSRTPPHGRTDAEIEAAAKRLEQLLDELDPAEVAANAATDVGGAEAWVEAVGPFYGTATVAAVLGVSMSTVYARTRSSTALSCRTGSGRIVFPVWQFVDGQVLPGLVPVLRILGGSDVSAWNIASWLRSPETELAGRTPLAVLTAGGEDELVLLVTSHAAAGWE